jgi:hypothetical protein
MALSNNERDFGRLFEKMDHFEQKMLEMSDLLKGVVQKQSEESSRLNTVENKVTIIEPEVKEFTRWRTFWTGYAFALMSVGASAGALFATVGGKFITWLYGS